MGPKIGRATGKLKSINEIAEYLRVSDRTLKYWVRYQGFPLRAGIAYKAEIIRWVFEKRRTAGIIEAAKSKRLRVFLCHASENKSAVREVWDQLTRDGFDPWIDDQLYPGAEWDFEIRNQIRTSDAIIIFLSPRSVRKEGYVQKEIKLALNTAEEKPHGTIFVIPARIEECNIPDQLRQWQCVDLFQRAGYKKLVESLRQRLITLNKNTT